MPDARDHAKGWSYVIDAASGAPHWRRQGPTPLVADNTATSGSVLFTSVGGGMVNHALDGKHCVAATSRVVFGFFGGTGTFAVIVFALP